MEAAPATDALICLYTNLNLKKDFKKLKKSMFSQAKVYYGYGKQHCRNLNGFDKMATSAR